ncbi:MAG: hypothetical protein H6672_14030 [Anaerolineaceae bacterium]|nr:hypothetical protein [Anaerolineaceae bacterium]
MRGVANDTVTELESRSYASYGEPFGVTGMNQTPYGFTGEPLDENGLLYLRARYYTPGLGVFTALDPFDVRLPSIELRCCRRCGGEVS